MESNGGHEKVSGRQASAGDEFEHPVFERKPLGRSVSLWLYSR
jgi:hypothetical protein